MSFLRPKVVTPPQPPEPPDPPMQMQEEDTVRAEAMADEAVKTQRRRRGRRSTIVAGGMVEGAGSPSYGGTPTILG
tara:strand:- start:325 stop:552 length:228 start_codon:yes stop_codon:yes gene_type:complete